MKKANETIFKSNRLHSADINAEKVLGQIGMANDTDVLARHQYRTMLI